MHTSARFCVICSLLFITVHRLPAPIQEQNPTPAAKPFATQKPKPKVEPEIAPSPKTTPVAFNIPQSQMKASATSQRPPYEAGNAIDGNVKTIWHTPWGMFGRPTVSLPQSIVLNLGGTYNIGAVHYLPRQDSGRYGHNGIITTYRLYTSTDGSSFTLVKAGNWIDDQTEKAAIFTPTKAAYIRLEAVATHGGWASAAELNVSGTR